MGFETRAQKNKNNKNNKNRIGHITDFKSTSTIMYKVDGDEKKCMYNIFIRTMENYFAMQLIDLIIHLEYIIYNIQKRNP